MYSSPLPGAALLRPAPTPACCCSLCLLPAQTSLNRQRPSPCVFLLEGKPCPPCCLAVVLLDRLCRVRAPSVSCCVRLAHQANTICARVCVCVCACVCVPTTPSTYCTHTRTRTHTHLPDEILFSDKHDEVALARRRRAEPWVQEVVWSKVKSEHSSSSDVLIPFEEHWRMDADMDVRTLTSRGALRWARKDKLTLKSNYVLVATTGVFEIGTKASPWTGTMATVFIKNQR